MASDKAAFGQEIPNILEPYLFKKRESDITKVMMRILVGLGDVYWVLTCARHHTRYVISSSQLNFEGDVLIISI